MHEQRNNKFHGIRDTDIYKDAYDILERDKGTSLNPFQPSMPRFGQRQFNLPKIGSSVSSIMMEDMSMIADPLQTAKNRKKKFFDQFKDPSARTAR